MNKSVEDPNYQIKVLELKNKINKYDLSYNDIVQQAKDKDYIITKFKLSKFFNFKLRSRRSTYTQIQECINLAIKKIQSND